MNKDFIFYEFSRPKIERLDFTHFLQRFAVDRLPSGGRLREIMGAMVFCIHGYDDDPRELHMIPEVRRFYSKFSEVWPYWFYFCDLHQDSLRVMTLCCLDSTMTMQVDGSSECAVQLDLEELSHFVEHKLGPMNEMCRRAGMKEEQILRRTIDIFRFYGLPFSRSR